MCSRLIDFTSKHQKIAHRCGQLLSALSLRCSPSSFYPRLFLSYLFSLDTERYLGVPGKGDKEADDAYARSSVLPWAPKLDSKLLILHGTADENVVFGHSLMLTEALQNEGKFHEFMPLMNMTHMMGAPSRCITVYSRIMYHFIRHLRPE